MPFSIRKKTPSRQGRGALQAICEIKAHDAAQISGPVWSIIDPDPAVNHGIQKLGHEPALGSGGSSSQGALTHNDLS